MQCACSATSAVCSVPAVVAVSTALSEDVDAVPRHWMQCPTMCMQYVVMEDAVPMNVDAVTPAVVAVPPVAYQNVDAVLMLCMPCH